MEKKLELLEYAKALKQQDKAKLLNIIIEAAEQNQPIEDKLLEQLGFIKKWNEI